MIFILCALQCEAKPLITHFNLKFCSQGCPYKIYRNKEVALIVTGVGKIRMAAAVSYLYMFIHSPSPAIWLNIGIGGMADVETGTGFLAHKVTDRSSRKSTYPSIVFDAPCQTVEVVTVDRPDSNHQEGVVFDMEASGFFHAAILFSHIELVHAYKVISDFDEISIKEVTKQSVSQWIENKIPEIEVIMNRLSALVEDVADLEAFFERILKQWHFSTTESVQLRRVLDRWEACKGDASLDFDEFSHLKSAGEVIKSINKRIQSTPLTYP